MQRTSLTTFLLPLCLAATTAFAQIPLGEMHRHIQSRINQSARRPAAGGPAARTMYAELANPLLAPPDGTIRELSKEQRQFLARCEAATKQLIPLASRAAQRQRQNVTRIKAARVRQGEFISQEDKDEALERESNLLNQMEERLHAMRKGELIVPPFFSSQPAIGDIGRFPAKSNPVRVGRILDATSCMATIQWPDVRADIIITAIDTTQLRPNDDLIVEFPLRVQKLEHRPQLIFEAFDAGELTPLWSKYKLEPGLD